KKELVGSYKNGGRELRPKYDPELVNLYDFCDQNIPKAVPYGVFDLAENQAWVSVGISHDTAEFAVETIRTWWQEMGRPRYPEASSILIMADGGGSNGYRLRLWKVELQKLADEVALPIEVCHLPPGTSKWNKISHSRQRRMLLKINDLFHSAFANIKPIESTTYVFYAIRNVTSFALNH